MKNLLRGLQGDIFYILISISVGLATVAYMHISGFYYPKIELVLTSHHPEVIRIHMDNGAGFSELNSVGKRVQGDVPTILKFTLKHAQKVRIDFGDRVDSKVVISGARLINANGTAEKNLILNLRRGDLHDASLLSDDQDVLGFQSSGTDPYIVLYGDFSGYTSTSARRLILSYLLILGFVCILLYLSIKLLRQNPGLFLIILIGLLLRALYLFGAEIPTSLDQLHLFYFDESTYFKYVNNLLQNGLVEYFASPASLEVAPGNILYLSVLMKIFNYNLFLARLFNLVVLGGGIIIFAYLITDRFFGSKPAVVASALVALYPELIHYGPSLLTEPLFSCSLIVFVFLFVQLLQESAITKKDVIYIIVCAVVGTFAALTRVVFLPFYSVLLLLALYLYLKKYKFTALKMLIMICISGAMILPFLVNGFRHSGQVMISTGSGAALWLGSRLDTDGDQPINRGISLDWEPITKGASHLSLEGDRLLRAAAIENIKQHPMSYILMCFKKIGRLLIGNSYFWFRPYPNFLSWYKDHTSLEALARLLSLFFAVSTALLGILGAAFFARDRMIQPVVFLMLFMVAVYIPFFVSQRYGLPIFLLNAIFTGGFVVDKKFSAYKFWPLAIIPLVFGYIILGV